MSNSKKSLKENAEFRMLRKSWIPSVHLNLPDQTVIPALRLHAIQLPDINDKRGRK